MAAAKVTPPSSHPQSTTITHQREARHAELTFLNRTLNPTSTQSCGPTPLHAGARPDSALPNFVLDSVEEERGTTLRRAAVVKVA
jgi:hypothetical protein